MEFSFGDSLLSYLNISVQNFTRNVRVLIEKVFNTLLRYNFSCTRFLYSLELLPYHLRSYDKPTFYSDMFVI